MIDYDKIIKVNSISFFGPLRYVENNSKKNIWLFYKQGKLQYVSAGRSNSLAKKALFKIDQLSDSLNILSSKYYGRYFFVDTLYFFESMCVIKTNEYRFEDADVKTAMPQKTDFRKYTFGNNRLTVFHETFQPRNGFIYNESIEKYLKKNDEITPSLKPTITSVEIDDVDMKKMIFFENKFVR